MVDSWDGEFAPLEESSSPVVNGVCRLGRALQDELSMGDSGGESSVKDLNGILEGSFAISQKMGACTISTLWVSRS